jgi:hypothetical protein
MAGQKREARLRTDDRAIHDLLFTEQDVDARHKAGHDEKENKKAGSDPGLFFHLAPLAGRGRRGAPGEGDSPRVLACREIRLTPTL